MRTRTRTSPGSWRPVSPGGLPLCSPSLPKGWPTGQWQQVSEGLLFRAWGSGHFCRTQCSGPRPARLPLLLLFLLKKVSGRTWQSFGSFFSLSWAAVPAPSEEGGAVNPWCLTLYLRTASRRQVNKRLVAGLRRGSAVRRRLLSAEWKTGTSPQVN